MMNQHEEEKKSVYPVAYHSKVKPIQIDKLKTQYLTTRTFHLQRKHELNQTFLNSPPPGAMPSKPQQRGSIFEPSQQDQQSNLSLTRTRFSQHHRALSELRSFQQLQHQNQHETSRDNSQASPKRPSHRGSVSPRDLSPKAISPRVASLEAQPPAGSTHKLKVVKEREAKIEALRIK